MTTDRSQQLLLALLVTAFSVYVGYTHPGTVPALCLGAGVFAAVALVLKL